MIRDILKQMIPFFILLLVLWVAAEVMENAFLESEVIAPPVESPVSP